jgi:hypothetical protein
MFCLGGLNFQRIIILNMKAPQSFKMLGTICPTMQHSSSSRGDGGGGVGQK